MLKFFYDIIFNVKTYKFILSILIAGLIFFVFSRSFDTMIRIIINMFPGLEGFTHAEYVVGEPLCNDCGDIMENGLKNENESGFEGDELTAVQGRILAENTKKNNCNKCLNDHKDILKTLPSNYLSACTKIATDDASGNEPFLQKLCQFSIENNLWTTSANPERQSSCPNGCKAPTRPTGNCDDKVYIKDISGTTKQIQYRFCPYKSDTYGDCQKCGMKLMKVGEYDTETRVYTQETPYERAEKDNAFEEEEYDDNEARQLGDFTPNAGLLQGNRYSQGRYSSNTNEEPDRTTTNNMFGNNNEDDHAGYGTPPGLGFNTHNDDPRYGNSPTIMDYKGWNPNKPPKFYNALMSLF